MSRASSPARIRLIVVAVLLTPFLLQGSGCGNLSIDSTPPPISISLSLTTASVQVQETQTFTATVNNDSQNQGVTWSLSATGCSGSACGTLINQTSTSVMYNAPATVPSSTVTLTAMSVSNTSKTASATITVTPPAITVTVAPANPNVQADIGTQDFTATVANDSQNRGVTWSLSGASCGGTACGTLTHATSTTVSYAAPTLAPSPAAAVTLTATSLADNTRTGTATITVTAPIDVIVSPAVQNVDISQTQPFAATVANDTLNQGVTWSLTQNGSSCTPGCGSISASSSSSGVPIVFTAPANIPTPATVTLTAASKTDTNESASATITITPPITVSVATIPPVNSLLPNVQPRSNYPLSITQSQAFAATVQNDINNQGVTWSISTGGCNNNPACGALSSQTTTSVTYTAPNTLPAGQNPMVYTLTATSVANPAKSGSATIPVSQGIPTTTGWFEVPNTQIYPICPTNPEVQGQIGCVGVIAAWSGGVADTTQNRLLFMGGGHENYSGDEVYALSLSGAIPTMTLLTNPTLPTATDCFESWGNPPAIPLAPAARETYGGLTYISASNEMWLFGGAPVTSSEPCRSGGMWTLDLSASALSTNPWTQLNQALTLLPAGTIDLGGNNNPTWINGGTETDINYSDYAAQANLVYTYAADSDVLLSYDPNTKTVTQLASGEANGFAIANANAVYDPQRNIFLMIGGSYAGWFDLNQNPPPLIQFSIGGTTPNVSPNLDQTDCGTYVDPLNSAALEFMNSPGLAYDPMLDRVIGWAGGNTVYVIDTTQAITSKTIACTAKKNLTGGPPAASSPQANQEGQQFNGTFGRFRYFPALDVFAVVNDWQQNAFTLRLPNPPLP